MNPEPEELGIRSAILGIRGISRLDPAHSSEQEREPVANSAISPAADPRGDVLNGTGKVDAGRSAASVFDSEPFELTAAERPEPATENGAAGAPEEAAASLDSESHAEHVHAFTVTPEPAAENGAARAWPVKAAENGAAGAWPEKAAENGAARACSEKAAASLDSESHVELVHASTTVTPATLLKSSSRVAPCNAYEPSQATNRGGHPSRRSVAATSIQRVERGRRARAEARAARAAAATLATEAQLQTPAATPSATTFKSMSTFKSAAQTLASDPEARKLAAGKRRKSRVRFKLQLVQRSDKRNGMGSAWKDSAPEDRVFKPASRFMYAWGVLRLTLWCFTVFWWPMRAAFEDRHSTVASDLWHLGDALPDIYFIFDIGVTFFTAFPVGAELETDLTEISRRYTRTHGLFSDALGPSLWIALIALVPIHVTVLSGAPPIAVKLSSFTRLLRVQSLWAWFTAKEKDVHFAVQKIASLKFILAIFGVSHWIGCLWWWVASWSNFDESTWIAQYVDEIPPTYDVEFVNGSVCATGVATPDECYPFWFQYSLSLFWGFQAMVGTSSGIMPGNAAELSVDIIVCGIQMCFYAYILGTLFHYVVHKDEERERTRQRHQNLEAYGRARSLPAALCAKLRKHFQNLGEKTELQEHSHIEQELPGVLVAKIANFQHRMLINGSPLFHGAPEQYLTMLAVRLKPRLLLPGELLYKKSDMSREMGFIKSGAVDVFEDAEMRKLHETIEHGCVGETVRARVFQNPRASSKIRAPLYDSLRLRACSPGVFHGHRATLRHDGVHQQRRHSADHQQRGVRGDPRGVLRGPRCRGFKFGLEIRFGPQRRRDHRHENKPGAVEQKGQGRKQQGRA